MILTGLARLGADAELRYTPSGDAVCNLRLAFNYGKKDGDGKRPSQWIDASLWGKRAEALATYLKKGTAVDIVASEPHIETYQKTGGGEGVKLVARIVEIELAGGNRDAGEQSAPRSENAPAQKPTNSSSSGGFGDFDDIPFLQIGRGAAAYCI